jgi:hypothetical protein
MKRINAWLLDSLTSPSLLKRSLGLYVHHCVARFLLIAFIAAAGAAYLTLAY